jgi:hypothetical protein
VEGKPLYVTVSRIIGGHAIDDKLPNLCWSPNKKARVSI